MKTATAKPAPKRLRNFGRLTDDQDSALTAAARELSRRRGTTVARADVTREALAAYLPTIGVVWPC